MPLKGIRTKQFYPYPEFRTMGDLDILYKEDQTKKLKQVMQDAGYKFGDITSSMTNMKKTA